MYIYILHHLNNIFILNDIHHFLIFIVYGTWIRDIEFRDIEKPHVSQMIRPDFNILVLFSQLKTILFHLDLFLSKQGNSLLMVIVTPDIGVLLKAWS